MLHRCQQVETNPRGLFIFQRLPSPLYGPASLEVAQLYALHRGEHLLQECRKLPVHASNRQCCMELLRYSHADQLHDGDEDRRVVVGFDDARNLDRAIPRAITVEQRQDEGFHLEGEFDPNVEPVIGGVDPPRLRPLVNPSASSESFRWLHWDVVTDLGIR